MEPLSRRSVLQAGAAGVFGAALSTVLGARPAQAAVYDWHSRGPDQAFGGGFAFQSTNAVLFGADDAGGVWRSTTGNSGSWTKKTTSHAFTGWTIAVKPGDDNTIMVGDPYGRGILKSTDGGATWSRANSGFPTGSLGQLPSIGWLHWSVHNTNVIYAAAREDSSYYTVGSGLWKTTNGGSSWSQVATATFSGKDVGAVYESYATPNTLLVGLGGRLSASSAAGANGIYRSTNGGTTWSSPVYTNYPITNFAGHSLQTSRVWMALQGLGVAVSTNDGATWTVPASQPSDHLRLWAVAVDPSSLHATNPARLYSMVQFPDFTATPPLTWTNVYKSTNNGSTWSAMALQDHWCTSMGVNNNGDIYVGTYDEGVRRYSASTGTWSDVGSGIVTGYAYRAVRPRPSSATSAVALHRGWNDVAGVFRRTTRTAAFTAAATQPQVGLLSGFYDIVRDPSTPATLYVACSCSEPGMGGTWKSTDDGATWSHQSNALDAKPIVSLSIHPTSGSKLYAGVYEDGSGTDRRLYVSTNGGSSFAAGSADLNGKWISSIAFHPTTPATMWAATGGTNFGLNIGTGLWKSTNSGTNWSQVSYLTTKGFYNVIYAPWDATQMYAAHETGLSYSTDSGATWSRPGTATSAGVTQATPGINRVDDKGSWIAVDTSTYALYYCSNNYYDTGGRGVIWQSNDGGFTWLQLSPHWSSGSQLGAREVWCLSVDPGQRLYASTYGSGVWELDLA